MAKSKYKPGDVLVTKAGTVITVRLIFYCNHCQNDHYQLYSKTNGLYSQQVRYFDAVKHIMPPTKASKILYGYN